MSLNKNLVELQVHSDERGSLVVVEQLKDIPFEIKRVFHIYDLSPEGVRGSHAHFKNKYLLVTAVGSCKITLDNGSVRHTYELNKPNIGLFQDKLVWAEMHDFSKDCVLIAYASEGYDTKDYIRDYDEFLRNIA